MDQKCIGHSTAKSTLKFTYSARCHLWRSEPSLPPWVYVPDSSVHESLSSFSAFTERLQVFASRDGFLIDFVSLYGSDHCKPSSSFAGSYFGNHLILLCDVARKAHYRRYSLTTDRLERFSRCTPWRGLARDPDMWQESLIKRAKNDPTLLVHDATKAKFDRMFKTLFSTPQKRHIPC